MGSKFSWKKAGQNMWQRLNKLLCNANWKLVFSNTIVSHLNRSCSDHAPLMGKFQLDQGHFQGCFKLQQMWTQHSQFFKVVQQSWESRVECDPLHKFAAKLKNLK